jgi:hypothetical protein
VHDLDEHELCRAIAISARVRLSTLARLDQLEGVEADVGPGLQEVAKEERAGVGATWRRASVASWEGTVAVEDGLGVRKRKK